jgi:hypothetical protein
MLALVDGVHNSAPKPGGDAPAGWSAMAFLRSVISLSPFWWSMVLGKPFAFDIMLKQLGK